MIRARLLPLAFSLTLSAGTPGVDASYMDKGQSPCADFYRYACGAYDSVPIPAAYASFGVNQEIDQRNEAILKEILEASEGTQGSLGGRLRDFYRAGMDEAAIERTGLAPLSPILQRIQSVKTAKDLAGVLALMRSQGLGGGPAFAVDLDDKDSRSVIPRLYQGGLGLPEREFYFRKDKATAEQRKAYLKHIARMLELGGTPAAEAKVQAGWVLDLETRLARVSRKLVDLRDPEANYHKVDRRGLGRMGQGFPWGEYLGALGLPESQTHLVVGQPEFVKGFSSLAHSLPASHWRAYLRWHTLSAAAEFLGKAFEEEDFAFYQKSLRGRQEMFPRWKRVLESVDQALGEDLGQAYVKRAFSPEAKARVQEMVRFHKEALAASLRRAPWMGEATKAQALRKLEAMRAKVGYPDRWRDYSALDFRDKPYVLCVLEGHRFEFQRRMAKLGKPVDRDEWDMTPQTNNAYYNPVLNEIVLPAGILQPPFFDERADEASNYGALASTIGHEILHGFDDEGCQYDADGNLKNWWTAQDRKAYEAMTAQVAKQYDAYEPQPGLHIQGRQTLGENLADIGGLKISLEAWKLATAGKSQPSLDGLEPIQRFFVAFAQGWRTNTRPEALRLQVQSDVHSPVRWRVLGPAEVLPEFRGAFSCQGGSGSFTIW